MKEEALCHPAGEVQVQGVHAAGAVQEVVVRAAEAAVHQADAAVHPTAAPTAALTEAAEEIHQHI